MRPFLCFKQVLLLNLPKAAPEIPDGEGGVGITQAGKDGVRFTQLGKGGVRFTQAGKDGVGSTRLVKVERDLQGW